jgi:signal transduction histidine kinase
MRRLLRPRTWPASVRSATAAGLIAGVLFTGGALWLRLAIGDMYDAANESRMEGARTFAQSVRTAIDAGKPVPPISRAFEVVHSDGRLLASGSAVQAVEQSIGRAILPAPSKPESGRTFTMPAVVEGSGAIKSVSFPPQLVYVQAVPDIRDGGLIAIYVLMPEWVFGGVSDLDWILWLGVPAATLLVALVAWASAARALRPVDWIRVKAKEISARSLNQRFDVPSRGRLSIGIRAAIAAALMSSGPLIGGAVWLRHSVDDAYNAQWMAETELALSALDALTMSTYLRDPVDEATRLKSGFFFEIVYSDGRLDSSLALKDAEERNDGPLLPPPRGNPPMDWFVYSAGLRIDDQTQQRIKSMIPPVGPWLRVWNREVSTGTDSSAAIYVFEVNASGANPAAAMDNVLWPGIPAAMVLIGFTAWLATTRALRPVEQIRVQAEEISAGALDVRVPVPPSRDAISRLAVTLNETLDRLEHSAEVQRQFIADAAHELRSPIASLRTVLEVAADHPDKADWLAVVCDAVTDTQRLQALAEDLLLLARLDSAQPLATAEVDLTELVTTHLAGNDHVQLNTNGSAPVQGDAKQLDRLLRNLVDNATRHAASTVSVALLSTEDSVILEVADDGPGIPPADRDRIFDRFTRLDEARDSDAGGAGLGLAIAREIAVRHGGTLTIGGQYPGAVFTASLPRG